MMPQGNQPVFILQEGTEQRRGKTAQDNNISAAIAVGDAVKSTLGPKGMDKMLVDSTGGVIITNDGATILREAGIEHPAAKMVVEVSQTQEARCYDGTTSAVVLSAELLRQSQALLDKGIHPTTITRGYQRALAYALNALDGLSTLKRPPLALLAATSLTGKSAESSRELLANLCSEAIDWAKDVDRVNIVPVVAGDTGDTYLHKGVVLEKDKAHPAMPDAASKAKVALLSCGIEVKKSAIESQVQITDPAQIAAFLAEEEEGLKRMVNVLVEQGVNVVVSQKGIEDLAQHYLRRAGVLAIEKVTRGDLDALASSMGGSIVSDLDDFRADDVCDGEVTVRKVGDHPLVFFLAHNDSAKRTCTILAHGSTSQVAAEVERALDDALGVVHLSRTNEARFVCGAGSIEAALATGIELSKTDIAVGRERMAVEAFSKALWSIPETLATNAGLDPVDVVLAVEAKHRSGEHTVGVNVEAEIDGGSMNYTIDAEAREIMEPEAVVRQALKSATEAAIMVLRIDDVILMNKEKPMGPPMGM